METDDAVEARIEALAAKAREASAEFAAPAEPPAGDEATRIVREGLGPVVSLFVEVRTGGRAVHFPPETYDRLERAMNEWLALYAACHGVELDADYEIRTAAQLLVDTRDARDVAQILTGVPDRE